MRIEIQVLFVILAIWFLFLVFLIGVRVGNELTTLNTNLTLIHTDLQQHNQQLETAAIWFKDRIDSMGECER